MAIVRTNKGAQALKKICEDASQADVRRRLGVKAGVVTRWVSGKRNPDALNAVKLEKEYGIPCGAWWEAVTENGPRGAKRTGTNG